MKLNGGRTVTGVLRGFDPYMNIVMDDTVEERSNKQKSDIGMVVKAVFVFFHIFQIIYWGIEFQLIFDLLYRLSVETV